MSQFERDLRESLRPRQPPVDFAANVLARVHEPEVHKNFRWRWLAVAALIVLTAGGTEFVREQRRQAESERTKQQLMVAFRITGSALRKMQTRLSAVQERIVYPQLNP